MKSLFLVLILCVSCYCKAQNAFDPDLKFAEARKLAFEGKKDSAEIQLQTIINKYPNYDEVRLFLGTVYSWNEKYKLARKEFQSIIDKNPKNKDCYIAFIKNELWANQPMYAIEVSKKALENFSNDVDILLLKASAEKQNLDVSEANLTINSVIKLNPENKQATEVKKSIKDSLKGNEVSFRINEDYFSQVFDKMSYYSIQYGKETKYGSAIIRYNLNNRFNTYGSQIEIDAYPSLGKGFYGYLNVGYSKSSIFPSLRYGMQIYKNLPSSFEVSAGIRALKFSDNYTYIYTGSVGKYIGNSFLFFVPYLIPSNEGLSKSGTLNFRKYRSNENTFLSLAVGMGFSPELNRFGLDITNLPIVNLKSQKIMIGNSFSFLSKNNFMELSVGLTHQESIFDPGQYFWIGSITASYSLNY